MEKIKFEKLGRGKNFMYDLGGQDKLRKYKKLESEYTICFGPEGSETKRPVNCVCLEAGDLTFCPYETIIEPVS